MAGMGEVKEAVSLRAFCEAHLERRGKVYVCPACGSGTGPNRTPAFSIKSDDKSWKCFSCNRGGDVFDLAGILNGTEDKAEQLRTVAEWAGVEDGSGERRETPAPKRAEAKQERARPDYTEGRERHRAYVKECLDRMRNHPEECGEALSYLKARGLQEVGMAMLGWDPATRRIVIPWHGSDYYHIDRDVTGKAPHKYSKPKADEVGPQPMWNRAALSAPACFVVEGALDAVAVEACGRPVVALGGLGYTALLDALASTPSAGVPILMLDADKAGREAEDKLAEELSRRGTPFHRFDWSSLAGGDGPQDGTPKDAAEALAVRGGELAEALRKAEEEALANRDAKLEEAYLEALAKSGILIRDPADVVQDVYLLNGMVDPVPTGMRSVDRALGGGLYGAGLIVVGAVSSVGKTTLVLQWLDNIARSGRPCLFVSCEQSAAELVSKSLSRIMSGYVRENGSRVTASAAHIMSATERASWDAEKERALLMAGEAYSTEIAPYLRIAEPSERPSVDNVRRMAEHMAGLYGQAPVVAVDYLQLLAPKDPRASDKQAVDENVSALRRMAKQMHAPVVAISSLNRAAYNGTVSMESFKESGAVEYSADQLLGLQPASMEEETEDVSEAKAKQIGRKVMSDYKRTPDGEVSLVVLKNRNGGIPHPVTMTYRKLSNLFVD